MARDDELTADLVGLLKHSPLSRRIFVTSSAATAAGYTLAAGPVRAQPVKTETAGLDAGDATVKVASGEMPVYFAKPSNVSKPPIILVAMEIFGLHEYIKDVTRRIAKLGAFAVAPNYYFTKGDLTQIAEVAQLMPLVNAKPDSELIAELDATARWASDQGGDSSRIGITGFCRGGRAVWVYCANSNLPKAGVAFYGSLVDPPAQKAVWPKSAIELAPEMKVPVLGLYGGADQGIPVAQVEAMKAALKAAGKSAEFRIYPDAPHAFHADYRPNYRKDAAEDAFAEMRAWYKTHNILT